MYKCLWFLPPSRKPHTEEEAPDPLHGEEMNQLGISLVHTIPPGFSQVPSNSARLLGSLGCPHFTEGGNRDSERVRDLVKAAWRVGN